MNWRRCGMFIGGVLFGTAGISILSSKDAKKAYTHCTAAVLRGKDCLVKKSHILRENCSDIYADARDINEERYAADAELEYAKAKAIVEAAEADE